MSERRRAEVSEYCVNKLSVNQSVNQSINQSINQLIISHVHSRVASNLTFSNSAEAEFGRISELKFGRSRIWLKLVFWSQNSTPVIIVMASTMLSAAIEAVHFSASFVALLFASYL